MYADYNTSKPTHAHQSLKKNYYEINFFTDTEKYLRLFVTFCNNIVHNLPGARSPSEHQEDCQSRRAHICLLLHPLPGSDRVALLVQHVVPLPLPPQVCRSLQSGCKQSKQRVLLKRLSASSTTASIPRKSDPSSSSTPSTTEESKHYWSFCVY